MPVRFELTRSSPQLPFRMKNEVQPKNEYEKRLQMILSRVGSEDNEWLKGVLAYSNEPRLEQRLNELLEKVHKVVSRSSFQLKASAT